MNKNNINSLYEFIKEQKEKKNRPLKIVCDWDECIAPVRPTLVYNFTEKIVPFKAYFNDFWERCKLECSAKGNKLIGIEKASPEELKAVEEFKKMKKARLGKPEWERKSGYYENLYRFDPENTDPDYYLKLNFLSITEQLLQTLKEDGLIEELFIMSVNSREGKGSAGKKRKFATTFGKFPNCKIKVYITGDAAKRLKKEGKKRPDRWKLIHGDCPDFDIFIDDNYYYIDEARKNLPDRLYVLPDYKVNRNTEGDNIYHLKTTVSDLKDQDFAIATLELKTKQLEKDLKTSRQERERERERAKLYWIMGGGTTIFFLGIWLVLVIQRKKRKKK